MDRIVNQSTVDPERILIVLPTWVGDVVMATPTLEAIRVRYPRSEITWLGRANVQGVIDDIPWHDRVELWPPLTSKGKQKGTLQLGLRLRKHRYDWVVLLTNSFRSGMVARLSGAKKRIGYARDGRGWLLTDGLPVEREGGAFVKSRMVDYYGKIAWAIGCEMPGDQMRLFTKPCDDEIVRERLAGFGVDHHHPLVVMTPGASFGPSKSWLPERYAEVCDRLVESDGARIVVTYGPGEEQIAHACIEAMRHEPVVIENPRFTLSQLKSLVNMADLMFCNDTGPRHFAKAFGKPVVTVFGPTATEWTDTDYPAERVVRVEVECGPCQQKVCPTGTHQCMTLLTVDTVYEAARELLATFYTRRSESGQVPPD